MQFHQRHSFIRCNLLIPTAFGQHGANCPPSEHSPALGLKLLPQRTAPPHSISSPLSPPTSTASHSKLHSPYRALESFLFPSVRNPGVTRGTRQLQGACRDSEPHQLFLSWKWDRACSLDKNYWLSRSKGLTKATNPLSKKDWG